MSSAERTAAFRTAASRSVGFGHLRRCFTLAQELASRGWRCAFSLSDEGGRRLAAHEGFEVAAALDPSAFDAMVVDDYAVTAEELAAWHATGVCLAVIDDIADRLLDCDLVQNGGAGADMLPYRTSPRCTLLLGPAHALLRPAFRGLPPRRIGEVRRVLVTLGGSDPQGRTPEVVARVCERLPAVALDVILGPLYSGAVPAGYDADRVQLHRAPADIAGLMCLADLAVTSGGQTTYELAACGVPAVALCAAENQRRNLAALAAVPTLVLVEGLDRLGDALAATAADVSLRQRLSSAGQRLVDGHGAGRVALALEQLVLSKRAHA